MIMSGKVSYEKLTGKNISKYNDFISGKDELDAKDETGSGIIEDGVPFGVVILQKTKDALVVKSVRVRDPEENKVGEDIFKGLNVIARDRGYRTIGCRFADDEPFVNEDFLRHAGFTGFDREAMVYSITAFELGRFLRDDESAKEMLRECERLLRVKKARCLSVLPPKSAVSMILSAPTFFSIEDILSEELLATTSGTPSSFATATTMMLAERLRPMAHTTMSMFFISSAFISSSFSKSAQTATVENSAISFTRSSSLSATRTSAPIS